MKYFLLLVTVAVITFSCGTIKPQEHSDYSSIPQSDTLITQSLFTDKNASITEEDIQKVLDGNYQLPQRLRIAIVKLDNPQFRRYYLDYWTDENYLKSQQAYLDLFSEKISESPRVSKLSIMPDLLIPRTPTLTNIREAAVRMQADVVVIYSISGDLYSKNKFFNKPDIKAFATTQLIMLDVRTGLIPFSTIVTKDYLSQKLKDELDNSETRNRIQNEAVLLTINDIGKQVSGFLSPGK